MSEPIIDEGLWDRVRDNEKHYARLLELNKINFARQFEIQMSTPELPYSSFASLFNLESWNANKEGTGVELTELFKRGLTLSGSMRLLGKPTHSPNANMFFDFEYSDSVARARIVEQLGIGRMCPNARGANGPDGAEGIPSVRHTVIVNPSPIKLPDWSKEILKFQSDEVEETEVPKTDGAMDLIGAMLHTYSPEILGAARMLGNEEAVQTVIDSFPYEQNLDPLTPEQIAIHNPPVKPVYRIPPRPEPKPRKEVSKRKSVAKAARKRTQAGRKKNRG